MPIYPLSTVLISIPIVHRPLPMVLAAFEGEKREIGQAGGIGVADALSFKC